MITVLMSHGSDAAATARLTAKTVAAIAHTIAARASRISGRRHQWSWRRGLKMILSAPVAAREIAAPWNAISLARRNDSSVQKLMAIEVKAAAMTRSTDPAVSNEDRLSRSLTAIAALGDGFDRRTGLNLSGDG